MRKNGFGYLVHLLLLTGLACTSTDSKRHSVRTTNQAPAADQLLTPPPCQQIIWQEGGVDNQYVYNFDAHQRLHQCATLEDNSGYGIYAFNQHLTYTQQGRLEQVHNQSDSSHYTYQKGQLASIDFFQEGLPIYRYQLKNNTRKKLVELRGIPLNNSGLQGYSTRYQLDEQDRYVQLDVFNERGKLYYRVIQGNFVSTPNLLARSMRGIPYDLNRHPWPGWGEQFPVSEHLASRVEIYRYASPQTPTQLIKRADLSLVFQNDRLGYITRQISIDALTTIRDTVCIRYLACY